METIFVTSAPSSYTDYCIIFYNVKGTTSGCLKLMTFCNKMRDGKSVKIGGYKFLVSKTSGIQKEAPALIEIPVLSSCDCTHTQACAICAESKDVDWSIIEQQPKPLSIAEAELLNEEEVDQKKLAAKPAAIVLVIIPSSPKLWAENQLTERQAAAFNKSNVWKFFTPEQIVRFQLFQERLCMDFDIYHNALNKVLKRSIIIDEFAAMRNIQIEYLTKFEAPTLDEMIDFLGADIWKILSK